MVVTVLSLRSGQALRAAKDLLSLRELPDIEDDVPFLVPQLHVAMCLGDLRERIAPVDHRSQRSLLGELREPHEIARPDARQAVIHRVVAAAGH